MEMMITHMVPRVSPAPLSPRDQGHRPDADRIGDDDDEEVEKADKADRRLDLRADEPCHVDVDETHEEIEDHDEKHRP